MTERQRDLLIGFGYGMAVGLGFAPSIPLDWIIPAAILFGGLALVLIMTDPANRVSR